MRSLDGAGGRAAAMLGPLLDQPGVTAVKLITLIGVTLIGVGLARGHYDRRVRGGNLERLVFERLRQLRLFGLPDWKAESVRWAGWAATWPAARVREGLRAARDRRLKRLAAGSGRETLHLSLALFFAEAADFDGLATYFRRQPWCVYLSSFMASAAFGRCSPISHWRGVYSGVRCDRAWNADRVPHVAAGTDGCASLAEALFQSANG